MEERRFCFRCDGDIITKTVNSIKQSICNKCQQINKGYTLKDMFWVKNLREIYLRECHRNPAEHRDLELRGEFIRGIEQYNF